MKTIKHILLSTIIALFVVPAVNAQVTAVMNVSANVISGAGVKSFTAVEFFKGLDSSEATIINGSLTIVNTPNTDVLVSNNDKVQITNQFGESIWVNTNSHTTVDLSTGTYTVQINPELPTSKLNGSYSGQVRTRINYM